jgi:hypothetical protein
MRTYRTSTSLVAITRVTDASQPKTVSLPAGTVVHVQCVESLLKSSGLVDVTVDNVALSMFIQDLEDRAERITAESDSLPAAS